MLIDSIMTYQNVVEFDNVDFAYDSERPILKNISLAIPHGKITAIMGGSGSGKTTLLRLITGQIKPSKGKIITLGQPINLLKENQLIQLRKKIGMLFQFGALFSDLSVAENLAFAIKQHTNLSQDLINKIVAFKLEAVGLFGTQNLQTSELSGGMARRIALARAIALDPELMLYDEPFTGLDPISLNIIATLIKKLNTSLDQTSILVTHDIEATLKIADYLYFMSNGEIIAEGTPEQVRVTENSALKQFIHGQIDGAFKFKYNTELNYHSYLGL